MKKILFRTFFAVVILLVAAMICATMFLDSIVKKGVVTFGPQVAKAPVTLDGVSLSLLSGGGTITGLTVENPEGFKTPSAIKVGKASMSIQPGSVFSDKIVVKSVQVEAPEITFEGNLKGSNLSKLLANIEEAAGAPKDQAKPGEKAPGKKLQVDEFTITGGKVNLSMSLLGGKSATVPLPEIRLTGLGSGPEGLTPAEVAQKVFKAILESATKAVGGALGSVGEGVTGAAKGMGKTAGEGLQKATKSIGGLFK